MCLKFQDYIMLMCVPSTWILCSLLVLKLELWVRSKVQVFFMSKSVVLQNRCTYNRAFYGPCIYPFLYLFKDIREQTHT